MGKSVFQLISEETLEEFKRSTKEAASDQKPKREDQQQIRRQEIEREFLQWEPLQRSNG